MDLTLRINRTFKQRNLYFHQFLALVILFILNEHVFSQSIPVIPLPNEYKSVPGKFILNSNTPIIIKDEISQKTAYFLQKELLRYTGIAVSTYQEATRPGITFRLNPAKGTQTDAYEMDMSPLGISISASNEEGLFYGVISLIQMARKETADKGTVLLTCWNVKDFARYRWRGFMLDESRHFFGKDKVKKILEWMAFYKLNRFHWHLTDQDGWRIEIRQYPRLGTVGGIGNHRDKAAPARYYTQEDIKEIVTYASERFISIIPEFDMPGHATAANMAYPEFSGGGSPDQPEFTFNPGKTEVYSYLTGILKELDVLFPSQMIHLGGDEVSFGNAKWNTDPDVQQLMSARHLKNLKAVEEYFVSRIADSILNLNNTILGWDEVVGSQLPKDKTIVMWWRQDQPQQLVTALDKGFSVVLCPRLPLYFDFVQDSSHKYGRRWQGEFNTLQRVYEFSHDQLRETVNKDKQILGLQANLWTETVGTEDRLDFLLFPRIAALAEAAWTETANKDFKGFRLRLNDDLKLFRRAGIYYFDPNDINHHSEPAPPYQQ